MTINTKSIIGYQQLIEVLEDDEFNDLSDEFVEQILNVLWKLNKGNMSRKETINDCQNIIGKYLNSLEKNEN